MYQLLLPLDTSFLPAVAAVALCTLALFGLLSLRREQKADEQAVGIEHLIRRHRREGRTASEEHELLALETELRALRDFVVRSKKRGRLCRCLTCLLLSAAFTITLSALVVGDMLYGSVLRKHTPALGSAFDALFEFRNNESSVHLIPPGARLAAKHGLRPRHPVVFVPGIVSSGLEVWQGKPCAQRHFRDRFWGTSTMLSAMLLDYACWEEHIKLDLATWRDPKNVRLRAAQGLGAADYFVQGYHVWAKVIANLAAVGYSPKNMLMASYDWRLPLAHLETRDHYFSWLKAQIELLVRVQGHKAVVIAHSMGYNVMHYFMQWVQADGDGGGNGGSAWVGDHIHAVVNVAGAPLGTPKALAAVLAGEMKDTAQLPALARVLREQMVTRRSVLDAFRSFGSLPVLAPKGGDAFWGGHNGSAPDGEHPELFAFAQRSDSTSERHSSSSCAAEEGAGTCGGGGESEGEGEGEGEGTTTKKTTTGSGATATGRQWSPSSLAGRDFWSTPAGAALSLQAQAQRTSADAPSPLLRLAAAKAGSQQGSAFGTSDTTHEDWAALDREARDQVAALAAGNWSTDRAFAILRELVPGYDRLMRRHHSFGAGPPGSAQDDTGGPQDPRSWTNPLLSPLPHAPDLAVYCLYGVGKPTERSYFLSRQPKRDAAAWTAPFGIDVERNSPGERVQNGVRLGDGDGTVPLLSLGFMCVRGWQEGSRLNPGNSRVVTREYPHLDLFSTLISSVEDDGGTTSKTTTTAAAAASPVGNNNNNNNNNNATAVPSLHYNRLVQHIRSVGMDAAAFEFASLNLKDFTALARGVQSADHVDILGNWDLLADLVWIVTGAADDAREGKPVPSRPSQDAGLGWGTQMARDLLRVFATNRDNQTSEVLLPSASESSSSHRHGATTDARGDVDGGVGHVRSRIVSDIRRAAAAVDVEL